MRNNYHFYYEVVLTHCVLRNGSTHNLSDSLSLSLLTSIVDHSYTLNPVAKKSALYTRSTKIFITIINPKSKYYYTCNNYI